MLRVRYVAAALACALLAAPSSAFAADIGELGVAGPASTVGLEASSSALSVRGSSDAGAALESARTERLYIEGEFDYGLAKQQLDLMNAERAKVGASPLRMDAGLQKVAMQRAAECAIYFDHDLPDGSGCFSVFPADAGSYIGENIAVGSNTAEGVTTQWMNSSGHKANMLNTNYTKVGIGVFRVGAVTYWCQDFGSGSGTESFAGSGSFAADVPVDVDYGVVPLDGSGFNLNMAQSDPEPLKVGKTYELQVGIKNAGWPLVYGPMAGRSFTWASSDPSVATVSSTGVVTGVANGTATITATAPGGHSWSKTFSVSGGAAPGVPVVAVERVALDRSTLTLQSNTGEQLTATVYPENATNKNVTWSSSDDAVAFVSQEGFVMGVSPGVATVTVTTEDGSKTTTCKVTVLEEPKPNPDPEPTPKPDPDPTPRPDPEPTPTPNYRGFRDVRSDDWFVKGGKFDFIIDHKFMSGYGNGSFGPYDTITRGQVAVVLWNMAGKPDPAGGSDFSDNTNPDMYYYKAIRWARGAGVVSGFGDNTFAPNVEVTREQLCAMLGNYAKRVGGKTLDSDATKASQVAGWNGIAGWAKDSVAWAVNAGLISGKGTDHGPDLDGGGSAWRASMVTMTYSLWTDVLGLN